MRSANRLFSPPKTSSKADNVTHGGAPSFSRPIEEQLLQALLCNTIGDTFYADKKEMLEETKRVHDEALAQAGVVFYASALAYARSRGFMRTQPIYGLANLAAHSQLDPHHLDALGSGTLSLFEQVFDAVIKTPNDLMDFHAILRSLKGNDGGRRVKRVAGAWLARNMTEYWVIKYGAKKDAGAFSLRDLCRIYHPRRARHDLFDYVVHGKLDEHSASLYVHAKANDGWLRDKQVPREALLQLAAFEALKRAKTPDERVRAIAVGRLPHEVATSFAGRDHAVWKEIVAQLPVLALVRNLAKIERAGIMKDVRATIVAKLMSPTLARAKIFPFQMLTAMEHVTDAEVRDALRIAMETCLAGAETIAGKTLVALDVSGSMSQGNLLEKAAIFAIATARRAPGSAMILFNEHARDFPVSRVDSVMTQAESVPAGGGTDHGAIVGWLQKRGERFDNVVVVTDEQQERGDPFCDKVEQWRGSKLGKGSKFFMVNLAGYSNRGALLPAAPGNFSAFGALTESTIAFLAKASRGWGSFVEELKSGAGVVEESTEEAE